MPTIGPFHRFYWKARANPIVPPGVSNNWSYPAWQSVINTMHTSIVGLPLTGAVWRAVTSIMAKKQPDPLAVRLACLDLEQRLVLERVLTALESPEWPKAQAAVREAAAVPKGHQPSAWLECSRSIKENVGQAVSLWRHLKAVSAIKPLTDAPSPLSDADARLVVELAYHAFTAAGRPNRKILEHRKVH